MKIKKKLLSLLSFSVDDIVPIEPETLFKYKLGKPKVEVPPYKCLMKRLKDWNPEEKENTAYEKLCTEVFQYLFTDDLTLWRKQCKSNDSLFRFDVICKIKEGNEKEFWKVSEAYFNSKYVILEYKNYTKKITQKEIYTTEKYLYLKALRGIAIIVSTKGTDDNADKAIRGILRENGKLIISLSNQDLINMLQQIVDKETPAADYLSMKLDDILIDLEK